MQARDREYSRPAPCGADFSATMAWIELIIATALIVGIALLIARWVVLPIRDIADTVGRFGPTSLGLRLRPTGPRDERALAVP